MPKKIRRYRILSIAGPFDRGTLHQFHDYTARVELDSEGAYATDTKDIIVRFFDTSFFAIQLGAWGSDPASDLAKARVAHYLIEEFAALLVSPLTEVPEALSPTKENVIALQQIDPAKVAVHEWHEVPKLVPLSKRRVFISCGQQSQAEIALGSDIVAMIKEHTGLDGYFAENQQSLEGVTHNIFNAIYTASGFVAIMHRRDAIASNPPRFRASVWVEQEVAIAAFLVQALGLGLPSRIYIQTGIPLEGVRGLIMVHPIEFETSSQILEDIPSFLSALPNVLTK